MIPCLIIPIDQLNDPTSPTSVIRNRSVIRDPGVIVTSRRELRLTASSQQMSEDQHRRLSRSQRNVEMHSVGPTPTPCLADQLEMDEICFIKIYEEAEHA